MTMLRKTLNSRDLIFENGSYKLVSLLVTLILWVTILGRRDFMLTKDMDVEFLLPSNAVLEAGNREKRVTVKVTGPRTALKKFSSNPGSVIFDLTKNKVLEKKTKIHTVIQVKNIEVPFGVKVVSIEPSSLDVVLSPLEVPPEVQPDVQSEKRLKGLKDD